MKVLFPWLTFCKQVIPLIPSKMISDEIYYSLVSESLEKASVIYILFSVLEVLSLNLLLCEEAYLLKRVKIYSANQRLHWMTSSVTYICKQLVLLIPRQSDEIYLILSCFRKSWDGISILWFIYWSILFSVSSGTVFEFVVMRRSLLTHKGKYIFRKSTALQ